MADSNKITIAQIANQAGVSSATVSRVLNHRELVKEDTVNQVKNAMGNLGVPFPEYVQPVSIGQPVIIINVPRLDNIFYMDVIHGAAASATAHGCHLLINQSPLDHGSADKFGSMIQSTNASGVILLNQVSADVLQKLNNIIPIMQCCEFNEQVDLPYVGIDDFRAAQNATEYIISTGRNKIAFINGPLSFKYARERRRGFISALENAEISVPSNWIVSLPITDSDCDMAYAVASRLLTGEVTPNAFFTASDTFAASVIKAAQHYHFNVPKDIIVVGFDNTTLASVFIPSITTVSQPGFQEGFTACEMLLEKIADPSIIQKPILFETKLIIQESTNCQI